MAFSLSLCEIPYNFPYTRWLSSTKCVAVTTLIQLSQVLTVDPSRRLAPVLPSPGRIQKLSSRSAGVPRYSRVETYMYVVENFNLKNNVICSLSDSTWASTRRQRFHWLSFIECFYYVHTKTYEHLRLLNTDKPSVFMNIIILVTSHPRDVYENVFHWEIHSGICVTAL